MASAINCHLQTSSRAVPSREKLVLAGCEPGAGVFINDARGTDGGELRHAEPRT
jgi:hypothetical protein